MTTDGISPGTTADNNNYNHHHHHHHSAAAAAVIKTAKHESDIYSHSRSTKFRSVQHDKLWPTSIFVCQPSCLELTARTSATNHFNRTFQVLSKNVFIRADIALTALETFLFSGLYIEVYLFTYLLTYLLTPGPQAFYSSERTRTLCQLNFDTWSVYLLT